jgi:hypothetical protein
VAVSHLHSNISASWRTDASIKLSSVAASLTSVSARAMLTALIAGERDPRVLAQLAKGKMRIKIPQLVEALTGHFNVLRLRSHRDQLTSSSPRVVTRSQRPVPAFAQLNRHIRGIACSPSAEARSDGHFVSCRVPGLVVGGAEVVEPGVPAAGATT